MTTPTIVESGEARFDAHEHRDLTPGLAYIAETVEDSSELSSTDLWARLHRSIAWLTHDLRPHMAWEEAELYPMIDERAATTWATRLARSEHRHIEALIATLETDSAHWLDHRTARTRADIVGHLGAVQAVVAGHIEREERILLPVLDAGPGGAR